MGRRSGRAIAAAFLIFTSAALTAAEPPPNYFGLLGGLSIPDSDRNAERGMALHALRGFSLDTNTSLEAGIFSLRNRHETDAGQDRRIGASLDLHMGTREAGQVFFLLGGGGVHQYSGASETSVQAGAGVGYYLPLALGSDLIRTEVRWNHVFGDAASVADDGADEFVLQFGILVGAVPAATAKPQALIPAVDSDNDGVIDFIDTCPGTAAGLRVDGKGCPPDEDADGVPDALDRCPGTPAGITVNAEGCDPASYDADKDGVTNDRDRCPNSPAGQTVNTQGCVELSSVILNDLSFHSESNMLTVESYRVLDGVAESILTQPGITIEIAGHADSTGASGFNEALSVRRVYSVREYLIYRGVATERLKIEGYGERKPAADNSTKEGRAKNRRVEFIILNKATEPESAPPAEAAPESPATTERAPEPAP